MSISFYFDEHVHGAIARALQTRGVDVLTVQADGRGGVPVDDVFDKAILLGGMLVSRNADMLDADKAGRCRVRGERWGI